ncbi:Histone deacetylase complex subunit SAP18 [Platanthera guangdongensis]|uniref:Histone deacetylase complex subunit SAP18 n=1 Tax=Platanthera guangdongensis TaxID=2320717 RepID=A0ABR2LLJ2_9ASPA
MWAVSWKNDPDRSLGGNFCRRGISSSCSAEEHKKVGGHHPKEEFAIRGKEPKEEVQIYTWKDATLRELTDLVKEVAPAARKRDAKLSFAFVYPDKNGRFVVRPVGMTYSYGNGRRIDDSKTLDELSFQVIIILTSVEEKPMDSSSCGIFVLTHTQRFKNRTGPAGPTG